MLSKKVVTPSAFEPPYLYQATVTRVIDGDTFKCNVDCGFKVILLDRDVRMYGINAPELHKKDGTINPPGVDAGKYLRDKIEGKIILLQTRKDKDEKYGRILGTVFIEDEYGHIVNVNADMVKSGHAIVYYG